MHEMLFSFFWRDRSTRRRFCVNTSWALDIIDRPPDWCASANLLLGGAPDGRLIIARHGTKRDADMLKNFIVLLPLPLEPCCSGSKAQLPDTLQNLPKCRLGSTAHGSICIQEG